jgi:hypothetical protein
MSVNEGNTIQYTVTTTKVTDNTTLYWRTTGNVNYGLCGPPQIIGSNNGTIVINNNQAVFNVSLNLNMFTDNTRTLGIGLSTTQWGPVVGTTAQQIIINDTSQSPAPIPVNYLVIGGGGTYNFGGGGAGAFVANTAGFVKATPYTIIVGGAGSLSSLNGASVPIITAPAGGNGGSLGSPNAGSPSPGGSGGGGSVYPYAPPVGTVTPASYGAGGTGGAYGNNGGTGGGSFSNPASRYMSGGGGGGGAGNAGSPGSAPACNQACGGPGGSGRVWPFTGGVTYAGGGGGGAIAIYPLTHYSFPGTSSAPGAKGSGAGGDGATAQPGVVILAVPTPAYPGSAPPAATVTTPPAAPGMTVLTFTTSGTITL